MILPEKIDYILDHPEQLSVYKNNIPKLKTITENADELISLYTKLLHNRKPHMLSKIKTFKSLLICRRFLLLPIVLSS